MHRKNAQNSFDYHFRKMYLALQDLVDQFHPELVLKIFRAINYYMTNFG